MSVERFDVNYSNEELAHYERKLSAEILKCKAAIERKKLLIDELQSKVFKNRKTIKKEEEELIELENHLIDLQSMTALDYLLLFQEKYNISSPLKVHGMIKNVGSAVETISRFIPLKGVSELGKLSGKIIKTFGNNKK
mgnify:CR=1 FL=1